MSLLVTIIKKEGVEFDIEILEKQVQEPHSDIFGVEVWSSTVWGHKVMKSLGCELIYSLQNNWVYAFDEDVLKLKREFELILENIDEVVKQTKVRQDSLEYRVGNALEAIRIVEENLDKAGIVLW